MSNTLNDFTVKNAKLSKGVCKCLKIDRIVAKCHMLWLITFDMICAEGFLGPNYTFSSFLTKKYYFLWNCLQRDSLNMHQKYLERGWSNSSALLCLCQGHVQFPRNSSYNFCQLRAHNTYLWYTMQNLRLLHAHLAIT